MGGPPMCSVPSASTWTWSFRATRATSPGILSGPTWLAATSPKCSRPNGDRGSGTVSLSSVMVAPEEPMDSVGVTEMSVDAKRRVGEGVEQTWVGAGGEPFERRLQVASVVAGEVHADGVASIEAAG